MHFIQLNPHNKPPRAVYLITSVSLEGKAGVQGGSPKHPSTADECGRGQDLTPGQAEVQHTFQIITPTLNVETYVGTNFLGI